MRTLIVGETAVTASVAKSLAKSSELFSIMQRLNPTIKEISMKYMRVKDINPEIVGTWAITDMVDIAVIVSRRYISKGIASILSLAEIPAIAPTKEATDIEWDKIKAIEMFDVINAKNPDRIIVEKRDEINPAVEKAKKEFGEFVVKPSYYTEGKGTKFYGEELNDKTLKRYIKEIIKRKGKAIIEKKIDGMNFVVQAFSDGSRVCLMPPVEVKKRYKKSTSQGFASYSNGHYLEYLGENDIEYIKSRIQRTINRLRFNGTPFKGILGMEFIKDRLGTIWALGYNSTFNDPGSINNMSNLKSELSEILWSIIDENLKRAVFRAMETNVVYVFPKGYPKKPSYGKRIQIDEKCIWQLGGEIIWHSIREKNGRYYTTRSRTAAIRFLEKGERDIDKCIKNLDFYRDYSTSSRRGAK